MRFVLAILMWATPAFAWEFTPGLPCVLTHATPQAEMRLTYDPTVPLYTITVARAQPWQQAPLFAMRFDGPQGRKIATDKHVLSDQGRALTVTNTGFGNLLDGLEFNRRVLAILGQTEVGFSLEGATGPVQNFRACDIPLS